MIYDMRPTELDMKCKEETTFHMSIRHKKTGITSAGSGDNKYALECELLEKIREKMRARQEKKDNE